ncbi:MAG: aldo/keto reductase [Anaerolineales bacterium]
MHAENRLALAGVSIPAMGIGAWAWGDRWIWEYGQGAYTDQDLQAAFDFLIEAGLNFFDTAELYGFGRSETLLGQFSHHISADVLIATKYMPLPWRLRQQNLSDALTHSLKRLGRSYVDLYQIHAPLPPRSIETWMDALALEVERGRARAVGVSNFNPEQTMRSHAALQARGFPLASNQVEYSLLNRKIERTGLLALCQELDITVIAYSPLSMGLLTGKYTPEHRPSGGRGRRFSREYLADIQPLLQRMDAIGEAHGGKSIAQVALNWVRARGAVPIPGVKNLKQAKENSAALDWQLRAAEVQELDQISDHFST